MASKFKSEEVNSDTGSGTMEVAAGLWYGLDVEKVT